MSAQSSEQSPKQAVVYGSRRSIGCFLNCFPPLMFFFFSCVCATYFTVDSSRLFSLFQQHCKYFFSFFPWYYCKQENKTIIIIKKERKKQKMRKWLVWEGNWNNDKKLLDCRTWNELLENKKKKIDWFYPFISLSFSKVPYVHFYFPGSPLCLPLVGSIFSVPSSCDPLSCSESPLRGMSFVPALNSLAPPTCLQVHLPVLNGKKTEQKQQRLSQYTEIFFECVYMLDFLFNEFHNKSHLTSYQLRAFNVRGKAWFG